MTEMSFAIYKITDYACVGNKIAYEVILGVDPWKNVSFDLIERVKHGYRPVIPNRAPEHIVSIIKNTGYMITYCNPLLWMYLMN